MSSHPFHFPLFCAGGSSGEWCPFIPFMKGLHLNLELIRSWDWVEFFNIGTSKLFLSAARNLGS